MTNPLSVLLIIGSAVVGPIEAQPFDTRPGYLDCTKSESAKFGGYVTEQINTGCRNLAEARAHTESLPELCERAMKEAGARRYRLIGQTPGANFPADDWVMNPGPDEVKVRCIPTPTGYKR